MSYLKKSLSFFCNVQSNGTDDQAQIAFLVDPVSLVPAGVGSGGLLSSVFNTAPADVVIASLTCALGIDAAHSSYSALTKTLTVKFNTTGTSGDINLLYGVALY